MQAPAQATCDRSEPEAAMPMPTRGSVCLRLPIARLFAAPLSIAGKPNSASRPLALALCAALVLGCSADDRWPATLWAQKTLADLCVQHPTDKCPYHHNYVEIYEQLFAPMRHRGLRILEIGVEEGKSMRLWEAYFPTANIFGLDIMSKTQHDSARVATLVADQGKREELKAALDRIGRDFDIIIDDGGHRMDQQQISFATLFPVVKPGGLYIIEDIHTSFPHVAKGFGVEPDGANSTYAMIDNFVRTGAVRSRYLSDAESGYLVANISYCAYYFRPTRIHSDFFLCRKK